MANVSINGILTINEFEHFQRKFFNELEKLRAEINPTQEWFNTKEACEYLGIGETKFYSLINKKLIKQYDLDGTKRYNRNELFEVLKNDSLY